VKNARDSMVSILFTEPVLGPDPHDSEVFLSTKHWLEAAYCIQSGLSTAFIDFEGEVMFEWPTSLIQLINWPKVKDSTVGIESYADRRERIIKQYPSAWSEWLDGEDDELRVEFERGDQLGQICQAHQRAPGGVVARLRKLTLVHPKASSSEVTEILNSRHMATILHEDLGAIQEQADSPEGNMSDSSTEHPGSGDPSGLHKFFYYDSAGVTRKTRIMNNFTGSCSCGGWQKIMGSVGSLKAAWNEHVEQEADFSPDVNRV
jgi:hypothetical protein